MTGTNYRGVWPYLSALADMFYPRRCVGCSGRASDLLCGECFVSLPEIGEPRCQRCGFPTAFETFVCGECKDVDYGFETSRAALRYEGVAREIVRALKYGGDFEVAGRLMAPLMRVEFSGERFDEIVPVPIHPARKRRRGFNQAAVMAESLAGEIGHRGKVGERLRVVRAVRDQVELTAAGRRENVRGAFRCEGRVRGRVLLVDDVFTTGATLAECATELLRAGATEVHAATFCRTC